jgi:TRAP-type mannitol/chloroaromatic compound transport system permease small subunit
VDGISTWVGKAAAWLILALMLLVCVEVFKRYVLNAPQRLGLRRQQHALRHALHAGGAYALAQNAHVRATSFTARCVPACRRLRPRALRRLLPAGIAALIYAGWDYAAQSWRINEHSSITADGPPIYPFKTIIPVAAPSSCCRGWPRSRAPPSA